MAEQAPAGFRYQPDFVTDVEEHALVDGVSALAFGEVRMHGVVARRRVAHFGWRYGYASWAIEPAPPLPEFLIPLRQRAAALGGVNVDDFAEALVTEYSPGAGIGWHRDAPQFGPVVVGISLLGECRLRFQRGQKTARQTYAITLAPRSAYVLGGAARSAWQHSISPTTTLRYSVTFRTLRRYSAVG